MGSVLQQWNNQRRRCDNSMHLGAAPAAAGRRTRMAAPVAPLPHLQSQFADATLGNVSSPMYRGFPFEAAQLPENDGPSCRLLPDL